ncbi:MAG: RAMP superfamily CRISPR-associated protein [Crinalium sp.]
MSQERLNRHQRTITKRIIVRGTLILATPTCLGSGDADSPTDLPLLRDSISDRALLTGASIAGALRNYLHEYEQGYNKSAVSNSLATKLFGHLFRYESNPKKPLIAEEENQSPLIINDALSSKVPIVELRDGVKIKGTTGTADDGAKYDLELLEAGTEFNLYFELLIEQDEDTLKEALALALKGLEKGEISIGIKKHRGFGCCHVEKWQVWEFNLQKPKDRIEWLKFDHWSETLSTKKAPQASIVSALGGVSLKQQVDRRDRLFIKAKFKLASPLLIRSSQNFIKNSKSCAPDVVHLRSKRKGKLEPIISGTSLAGVLWHRAERIVTTLEKDLKIVYAVFGDVKENNQEAKASRLAVYESVIEDTDDLVQSRIAIDRFTGGTYHGALFHEQPVFGVEKKVEAKKSKKDKNKSKPIETFKHLELKIELRQPDQHEIGLLLLLLKDLCTGDLPIGGTSSIGRGRLQGVEATISWQQPEKSEQKWQIYQDNDQITISDEDRESLEDFVKKFVEEAP